MCLEIFVHSMSRTLMAGMFSILLVISVVMGAYSMVTMPQVDGFTEVDIHIPGPFTAPLLPTPPGNITGTIMFQ
jgi:hypothetical protein